MIVFPEKRKALFWLLCILCFGAALNLYNIGFDLPHPNHPDEGLYVDKAMDMLSRLDLNPHFLDDPPVLTHIYAFSFFVYFVIWKALSVFLHLPTFTELWRSDPSSFYLIARSITAILGVGTCLITYRIGKKLLCETIGLISCALLSFSFLHVRESHNAVPDIPALFFTMLAFNWIVDIWSEGKTKSYILAGTISGIAIATKYNAAIIVFAFLAAYLLRWRGKGPDNGRGLFLYSIFCIAGFCIGCPWIILDAKAFLGALRWDFYSRYGRYGGNPIFFVLGRGYDRSYVYQLLIYLWGYGLIPLIFSAIGAVMLARKRQLLFMLGIFPLASYFFTGGCRDLVVRYTIPAIPFLCILSAYGIVCVSEYFPVLRKNGVIIFLTLIAVSQGLIFSIRFDNLIVMENTHTMARRWLEKRVASEGGVITKDCSPSFREFTKDIPIVGFEALCARPDIHKENISRDISDRDGYIIMDDWQCKIYKEMAFAFRGLLYAHADMIYSSEHCNVKIPAYRDERRVPFWNLFNAERPGSCFIIYKVRNETIGKEGLKQEEP